MTTHRIVPFIEIVSTPPGAAPDDIRAAWVGLKLKIANGDTCPRDFSVVSVHTRVDGRLRQWALRLGLFKPSKETWNGFSVDAISAIQALEQAGRASAAHWWRHNTPHILKPGQLLIFPGSCCQVVEEKKNPA